MAAVRVGVPRYHLPRTSTANTNTLVFADQLIPGLTTISAMTLSVIGSYADRDASLDRYALYLSCSGSPIVGLVFPGNTSTNKFWVTNSIGGVINGIGNNIQNETSGTAIEGVKYTSHRPTAFSYGFDLTDNSCFLYVNGELKVDEVGANDWVATSVDLTNVTCTLRSFCTSGGTSSGHGTFYGAAIHNRKLTESEIERCAKLDFPSDGLVSAWITDKDYGASITNKVPGGPALSVQGTPNFVATRTAS